MTHCSAQFAEGSAFAFLRAVDGLGERVGGVVIERAVKVTEDFEGVLRRGLWHEPGNLPMIADEHDFLLLALEVVQDRAEVSGGLGNSECFHAGKESDAV